MANRAFLLNTSFLTSDPYLLEAKLKEPGMDFVEVAEAAYKIPIPWLLCFRPEDIRLVTVQLEEEDEDDDDEDFDENGNDDHEPSASRVEVGLPCTSVKQALQNMEQARPMFEAIVGDSKLARTFWQNAMTYLQSMPLAYLTMNPLEVMFMTDPLPYAQQLRAALGGGKAAVEALMDLSCYEKGVRPFPLDVLYAVPGGSDRNDPRLQNCVALDIGYGNDWHTSADHEGVKRARLPLPILAPSMGPNLSTLLEEVQQLAKTQVKSASIHLSFAPRKAQQGEQLKMLISADTDAECNTLLHDASFRGKLDGDIQARLSAVCQGHGFSWLGFVFRSDESVQRRFKGDYSIYNDWVNMPVEKKAG
jgi:hypothetical protein